MPQLVPGPFSPSKCRQPGKRRSVRHYRGRIFRDFNRCRHPRAGGANLDGWCVRPWLFRERSFCGGRENNSLCRFGWVRCTLGRRDRPDESIPTGPPRWDSVACILHPIAELLLLAMLTRRSRSGTYSRSSHYRRSAATEHASAPLPSHPTGRCWHRPVRMEP